jgi:outer membrane protein assembly factor BamB
MTANHPSESANVSRKTTIATALARVCNQLIRCQRSRQQRAVLCAVLLMSLASMTAAEDPANSDLTRFLPNHGNSVYPARGLLQQWPAEGPKRLWQAEIGYGKSAIVEVGGNAFTATEIDEKQYAICLDPLTGAVRWKRLLVPNSNRHFAWGPVTSPVVDEDRVYMIGYAIDKDVWDMRCPIVCLSVDGEERWRTDGPFWATEASTPLVAGDTLYVAADGPENEILVALDKRTGQLRWSVAVDDLPRGRELAAASSLTWQQVDGVAQVIVATYGTREVLGVHAESGEILWRFPYPAELVLGMISTPVAMGPDLMLCANENRGLRFSVLLEMEARDGKIAYRERYRSTELQTNHYNTPTVHDGAVFGFGGTAQAGFLHCTDLADGRLLWQVEGREWTKDQNLVVADGLIFALTSNNELVLAEASRDGYRQRGRFTLEIEVGRPQQPTIANGRLYIRGVSAAACYDILQR